MARTSLDLETSRRVRYRVDWVIPLDTFALPLSFLSRISPRPQWSPESHQKSSELMTLPALESFGKIELSEDAICSRAGEHSVRNPFAKEQPRCYL